MGMSNTEKTVMDIRRKTRRKFSTEEKKSVLFWMDSEARVQLPNSAVERVSIPTCTAAGARTSWRLARSGYPAIPCEKLIRMR